MPEECLVHQTKTGLHVIEELALEPLSTPDSKPSTLAIMKSVVLKQRT
jgi:hypothetical protein